ncbi:hypothetical protein [Hymenobacter sp. BT559]|uniref:hypothetical protein n=1 Tax=Hymenobacter sp. BT559 TaxID=2795729 RepID=UPI0018EB496C|nr:hypothetical protein [Hymenobacter sp. BT559]MBJ6141779.1 hypothetical protein [Hymenobacter sp. BT559]
MTLPPSTPPPPLPTLTVTDERRAFLHAALVTQLHLSSGQPADLVPPSKRSDYWHLDLRPQAKRVISVSNGRTYRLTGLELPAGLLNPDEPALTLYLLPGDPARPGYYPLLPAAAFNTAYTAFLTQVAQDARQAVA